MRAKRAQPAAARREAPAAAYEQILTQRRREAPKQHKPNALKPLECRSTNLARASNSTPLLTHPLAASCKARAELNRRAALELSSGLKIVRLWPRALQTLLAGK